MQKQAIFVIVVVLVITVVGSFVLGSKLSQGKPRLIYVPTTKKAISSTSFLAKGSLIVTTGGTVKSVSPNSISIGENNNEATFKIDNTTIVFKRADNNNNDKTSTQSGKTKGFLVPEEKTTIDSIKAGQTVNLNVEVSEKEAVVRNIRIINE